MHAFTRPNLPNLSVPPQPIPLRMADRNELLKRITQRPGQCGGRPCIRGMRMRVSDVVDLIAGGMSDSQILAEYPYLEADDIRACLVFAALRVSHIEIAA